jgi:glutamyl-tRNA synthetase
MADKEKPRYDGTWRPEPGKTLPAVPEGVQPVLRFRNPQGGVVAWDDKVKGRIEIRNDELDDLVIARPDGTPTYNFCVVVDDIDMAITHVIRGDDHVNNTPRQINIFRALGKEPPVYAHLPTVLNEQGEKMSKRNGAKPVTQYRDEGYLPDAMVNYLARLGWSHGDDEIFSREQFLQWFNLDHLGRSAAQFDEAKLRWVNAQHLKAMADDALGGPGRPPVGEARHCCFRPGRWPFAPHLRLVQGPVRYHRGPGRLGVRVLWTRFPCAGRACPACDRCHCACAGCVG